jgi:hypothetical protein
MGSGGGADAVAGRRGTGSGFQKALLHSRGKDACRKNKGSRAPFAEQSTVGSRNAVQHSNGQLPASGP